MIAIASYRSFGSSAEHAATPRRVGRGWAVFAVQVCAACADERTAGRVSSATCARASP